MVAELIDTNEKLETFVERARHAPWLGLDTEFVRERTYFPRPGLIQIATPDDIALIDPVALDDLRPLASLLFETSAVKILHAAYQDLELLDHLFGQVPSPLFDTQVAAGLLDFQAQIGHSALVEAVLHEATPEALGRYNWLKRPLQPKALDYAAGDVIQLGALYRALSARLEAAGKTATFAAAMRKAEDPEQYRPHPGEAWRRIRARRLDEAALARLKPLARWREEKAIEKNLPRQWVLRNKALLALARKAPENGSELASMEVIGTRSQRRYGRELLALIAEAKANRQTASISSDSSSEPASRAKPSGEPSD
jgi:ribonuclease D